jgi:hypothetical protein
VLWLVLGELDRKPERELRKLEEVLEGEADEVHAAVDPVQFLGVGSWVDIRSVASDGRSADKWRG